MIGQSLTPLSGIYRMVREYRLTVGLSARQKGPLVLLASTGASLRISDHLLVPTTE